MSVHVGGLSWRVETIPVLEPTEQEDAWIDRARRGEEQAFRWLLDRYRDRVIRLATHVLRSPAEAEDVAQEAFVKAFRGIRAFRGESRFYTWLYNIVVHICLDRRRLWRWSHEHPWDSASEMQSAAYEFAETADSKLLVEALLVRLTPPMRAALVLRELEGLEYEEIALALELPVGTVRSRLNSARKQFRELWEAARRETSNV